MGSRPPEGKPGPVGRASRANEDREGVASGRGRAALLLVALLLIGCAKSPEQMVEDTKQQAQAAVNKKIDDEVNKVKKQISDLAGKKMEEAQNYVNDIKKTGSLSEASKKFITDTMKLKDGLAAAAASGPIEEAMKSGKENLPWIKKELEKAIQTSNGQAKIAWQQLLDRVNEAMKK